MEHKTLREICTGTKISRRAIQGYEKAGLVKADDRNKYGHLLYSSSSEERIKVIYFYQQIGFSVKEIARVIDAEDTYKKAALENKLALMLKEGEKLKRLIEKTERMIDDLK